VSDDIISILNFAKTFLKEEKAGKAIPVTGRGGP
jgi:hypothetical protein